MTGLGYRYRGENGIPGRFYFDKIVDGRTAVHAHMFPAAHPEVRKHLAFRDYLRTHPDAARNYELLKQRLASKYRDDRLAYTEAKAEFINRIHRNGRRRPLLPNPNVRQSPQVAGHQGRPIASQRNSMKGAAVRHESAYLSTNSGAQASSWVKVVPAVNDFSLR